MAEIKRGSGIRLTVPDGMVVGDPAVEFGDDPLSFSAGTVDDSPFGQLADALSASQFTVLDELEFTASADEGLLSFGVAAEPAVVDMEVPTPDGAESVLMLEQDGFVTWVFPEPIAEDEAGGDDALVSFGAPAERSRRFRIDMAGAVLDDLESDEPATGGFGSMFHSVRALVLNFVVEPLLGRGLELGVRALERSVETGPVWVRSANPLEWERGDSPPATTPAARGPIRCALVLVHGTFSSTLGSFGHLGVGPGADALKQWIARYDTVFGYDHRSLSETPADNAQQILTQLESMNWAAGAEIDIICYSRGGLVARTLVEKLLPTSSLAVVPRNVVCVATTNAGTLLAHPDNWNDLMTLFTNLSRASAAALAAVGGMPGLVGGVLSAGMNGIGLFVKAVAQLGLNEGAVPGLAAMNPSGAFIENLNGGPAPKLHPMTRYFAVTSDFTAEALAPLSGAQGFSRRLKAWLADGFVERLFQGAPNDLVVHTDSTKSIHPAIADRLEVAIHLEGSASVYHLNFFSSETTARKIATVIDSAPLLATPNPS